MFSFVACEDMGTSGSDGFSDSWYNPGNVSSPLSPWNPLCGMEPWKSISPWASISPYKNMWP